MSEPQPIGPELPQGGSAPAWTRRLWPTLIFLMAVLAYVPTLRNGFVFDDHFMIEENPSIRSLRQLPRILTTEYWGTATGDARIAGKSNLYRPLVIVSLALNYAVGGLDPLGYHAVNILLHAGVSLAVYGLGARLGVSREAATIAAALFAVHPLHTEVVAEIVGRAELLMALGVLLALAGFAWGGVGGRLGSLAAFALALLAKEQAVVLPAVLALHEFSRWQGVTASQRWGALARNVLLRLLPYAGILAGYFLIRAWVLGWAAVPVPDALDNPVAAVSRAPRILTALAVAGRYLTLCLWPAPLSPDYSYNQIPLAGSPLDGRVVWGVLLWGSLLALAARSFIRGKGAAGFAVGFTLLTFLPVSNLFIPIGTIMGERLFYLPSVGLCWLAGLGCAAIRGRIRRPRLRQMRWAVLGGVLVSLTAQTVRYGRIWRDAFSLFSHGVSVAPNSAKMHHSMGVLLLARCREQSASDRLMVQVCKAEATTHLLRATEISPGFAVAWRDLGWGHIDDNKWEEALAAFQKGLALRPGYPGLHIGLGTVYEKIGRSDEALAAFRQASALQPDLAEAHENLARIYEGWGWGEAAEAERGLALFPADPLIWLHAGSTFLRLGWSEEALAAFRQAVGLKADLAEAHLALAQAYNDLGRPREAAETYEGLLRLQPSLAEVHRRLAELYATRLDDRARAAAHLRQIQGLAPQPPW